MTFDQIQAATGYDLSVHRAAEVYPPIVATTNTFPWQSLVAGALAGVILFVLASAISKK